eukprot:scaffold486_cov79-Cylindrotheca_fusiformis.AAC.1
MWLVMRRKSLRYSRRCQRIYSRTKLELDRRRADLIIQNKSWKVVAPGATMLAKEKLEKKGKGVDELELTNWRC